MYGDGTREAMMRKDLSVNEGAIGENVVCQMLTARGITPYYYEVDKEVETDFVVEIGADLCTIEVKTGKKRRARSMKKLMEMESGKKVDRWIKFEYGNIMVTERQHHGHGGWCRTLPPVLRLVRRYAGERNGFHSSEGRSDPGDLIHRLPGTTEILL